MKKIGIISGGIAVFLVIFALAGGVRFKISLQEEKYNAAQEAYKNGEYDKAVELYKEAGEGENKYLRMGNSYFKQEDYENALATYKDGIIKYPQNTDLKHNYEMVKKEVEEDKNEQNQKDDSQEQDSKDHSKDSSQENEDSQKGEDKNSEDSQSKDSQNGDSQNEKSEEEESKNEDNESGEEGENQGDMKDSPSGEEGEESQYENQNKEEVMQVLDMLERAEEDSLKNNFKVKDNNKEDQYDW